MKLILYPFLIFCLLLLSCNNTPQAKALRLCNKAILITTFNPDTAKIMKAIGLLNKATDIQPDFYLACSNKFEFQRELGLTDDAFSTLKVMEQLRSENPDIKSILGAFYEYLKKDTIQAMIKYNEADLLYKSMLDTIKSDSPTSQSIIMGYAVNLRLLKTKAETNRMLNLFFQAYYYDDENKYEDFKKFIYSLTEETRGEILVSRFFAPVGG